MLKNGPYTRLIPDLKGVDPDDAFSIVPYEKGFTLLFYLETLLGGPGKNWGMKKCFKYFISQQVYKNVHIISLHKFCIK